MTERKNLIEAMALGLAASSKLLWADLPETAKVVWRKHATASLSAIEAHGCVLMPREATEAMIDAAQRAWTPGVSYGDAHAIRYTAMIEASPYKAGET